MSNRAVLEREAVVMEVVDPGLSVVPRGGVHATSPVWTQDQVVKTPGKLYLATKRVMDIVLSTLALLLLWPFFIIIAVAIKVDSPGPVIFKQTRVGKDGKEFVFYKFRSMCDDAEQQKKNLKQFNEMGRIAFKMKNDPRITRVGKFIRKTSIDELPQLINILKAEMTIVGPRPPLPDEVAEYNGYCKQRLSVKGGLTCYWQVSGRSNLSFDEWMDLDMQYINEMSLWTDIKTIAKTFGVVFKCEGAN